MKETIVCDWPRELFLRPEFQSLHVAFLVGKYTKANAHVTSDANEAAELVKLPRLTEANARYRMPVRETSHMGEIQVSYNTSTFHIVAWVWAQDTADLEFIVNDNTNPPKHHQEGAILLALSQWEKYYKEGLQKIALRVARRVPDKTPKKGKKR